MTQLTTFETDLQNKIANLLLQGKEVVEVCRVCECSQPLVYRVLHSAKYQQVAYRNAMSQLVSEGSPAAIRALIDIVKDKKAANSTRVTAADKILTHTGCIVNEQGRLEKSPSTMTQAELQQRLDELHSEAASRAKPPVIDGTVEELLG